VPGAAELCAAAVARDVVVSLGHQLATTVDLWKLAEAGATMLTHLGNGCPAMMHRHNNMIWPGLAEDRLSAMIITDGHHLPSNVIKTVLRAKGLERSIVVSASSHIQESLLFAAEAISAAHPVIDTTL